MTKSCVQCGKPLAEYTSSCGIGGCWHTLLACDLPECPNYGLYQTGV